MFLYDESTIKDLFYCAPAWSKTGFFFCHQFLTLDLESVENNSEQDLPGMAHKAHGTIDLTLLEAVIA